MNPREFYYQGRQYIVFPAKSHPVTYVYILLDLGDASRLVTQSWRRR